MEQENRQVAGVEGRRRSIWEQLVERKGDYVGGTLIDLDISPFGSPADPEGGHRTTIVDMRIRGEIFEVEGVDFSCSGNMRYLGVKGRSEYGNGPAFMNVASVHRWDIIEKEQEPTT